MAKPILSILVMNDPHMSIVPPSSRKETYAKDIARKLIEVVELAPKLNVDYVGCTGDFFHRKSAASFREAYILLSIFKKRKVIGIGGNHDLQGDNIWSMRNRPLGVLVKSGVVRLLDEEPIVKNGIKIVGTTYCHNYDKHKKAYFKSKEDEKYFTVAFTHGSLVLKEHGKFWGTYTNLDDLRNGGVVHDVILNGHLHHNQHHAKVKKSTIFSVGSISRNILSEDVAKRTPVVLHLEVRSDRTIQFEECELQSAKKFKKIFAMPSSESANETTKEISAFVEDMIKNSEDFNISNDKVLVEKIVKKKKFPDVVREKVTNYIEERSTDEN